MTVLSNTEIEKRPWNGALVAIQPRIRLGRSFDQRTHTYLGYALTVRGHIASETREYLVGVGEGAHTKHQFRLATQYPAKLCRLRIRVCKRRRENRPRHAVRAGDAAEEK